MTIINTFKKFGLLMKALTATILICRATAFSSVAEEKPVAPLTMDTIVVRAEKPADDFQTGDVDVNAIPVFCTVIERNQFEGKMEGLADVIEKETGIQVRRSGGLGSFSSMTLRGSTSEQVKIYLDGVLLNDASGGGVDLSNISLADIAAIEIYRGASPVNFSDAAIGGVVNIKTLRSRKTPAMSAGAGYGSFNTHGLTGFLNHKPGKWDYLLSADYLDSDNDFKFVYDNQTKYNTADDRTVKRNNAQFDQTSLLAKIGCDADDHLRADFSHHWFSKNQGLPKFNNSPDAHTSLNTKYNISTMKLTADDLTSLGLNTSTRIDYSEKKEEYDDSEGDIGLGQQHLRYVTEKFGGGIYLEAISNHGLMSLALDAHRETYTPENLLTTTELDESRRDTFTLGLQNRLGLFQSRFVVTPALRYTHLDDKLTPSDDWLDDKAGNHMSRSGDFISPQIGLEYHPASWLAVKTNLGQYRREPSFFELFGDRGFFLGNIDLEEEKGINFDIGLECLWQTTSRAVDGLSFKTVYFRNEVDDLITRVYDARGIGRSENISGSLISGMETEGSLAFFEHFTLTANATLQDTENQSDIPVFDGQQLPGRFEKSYLARLEAKHAGFKVFAEYRTEKNMYYDTANLLPAADKEELNAGLSWLYKAFLISFEANNISDNQYEDFNGYPLPGRSYDLKVKYTI